MCGLHLLSVWSFLCKSAHQTTQSHYPSLSSGILIASLHVISMHRMSSRYVYSFLPVLSRSASFTLPLRTPVHGLYSPSFCLSPRHVSNLAQSTSYEVSHI